MSGNFVGFFCSGQNLRANPSTVTVQSAIFENSIDFESHKFANDNFQMNATVIIKLPNEWNGAACAHPKMHENQIFELLKLDAFDAMGFAKCDRQPDREVCHGINNMGKPNIRTTNHDTITTDTQQKQEQQLNLAANIIADCYTFSQSIDFCGLLTMLRYSSRLLCNRTTADNGSLTG